MDQSLLEQIRQSNNIVEVIGSYIPLKRSGSNYKGVCPFHNDTNPSMMVSEPKQIFKCFACGKAGNVYTFVQDYEKVSFMEAVKKLALRVGITLEEKPQAKVARSKRELLITVYNLAKDYYKENLQNYAEAKNYLLERQVTNETIDLLEIGYALNSYGGLKSYLLKMNINTQIMEESGLFGTGNQGMYDLFRERMMFPIHSINGDVVAFGGRIMSADQPGGKYINSPTTDIYTKGKELYGLHRTRHEISKLDFAIVCEGYMDFLRLYSEGFQNTVATLGTSLTDEQIGLLSRYTKNVYMLYDGDIAGKKAALRAGLLLLQKGLNPKLVILPEEEDPDSYLLKNGKDSLKEKFDIAKSLVTFLYEDRSIQISEREKIEQLVQAGRLMTDEISRELFWKEVAEIFKISESALRKRPTTKNTNKSAPQKEQLLHSYWEEKMLLCMVLQDLDMFMSVSEAVPSDYFLNPIFKEIYEFMIQHMKSDSLLQPAGLLDLTDNENLRSVISEFMLTDITHMKLDEVLGQVKLRKYQQDLKIIDQQIIENHDNRELFKEKSDLIKKISLLSKKVVGKTLM
jgi:DNA primase